MVNALFSSKQGGTKQFKQGKGTEFGWKAIIDLYKRTMDKSKNPSNNTG